MSATAEQVSTAAAPEGQTTTIAALKNPAVAAAAAEAQLPEVTAGFTSSRSFALICRAGKALADSSLVPEIYRGNLSNCIIALEIAQRIGASALMVMQNLYIVYQRPAWSAKFLIACFNQCGRFSAVRYIWSGTRGKDDWGCQAWAIERETGEKILGPVITLQLAKDEKWYDRKDSKWKTMPEKMFMYRAAAWMIDTHAPELSMGIRAEDEVRDTYDANQGPDGKFSVTTQSLRETEQSLAAGALNGGSPHEQLPKFEKTTAIAEIKKATTLQGLSDLYSRIVQDFVDLNRQVPEEVEGAYSDRKAALEQEM